MSARSFLMPLEILERAARRFYLASRRYKHCARRLETFLFSYQVSQRIRTCSSADLKTSRLVMKNGEFILSQCGIAVFHDCLMDMFKLMKACRLCLLEINPCVQRSNDIDNTNLTRCIIAL